MTSLRNSNTLAAAAVGGDVDVGDETGGGVVEDEDGETAIGEERWQGRRDGCDRVDEEETASAGR